MSLEWLRLVRKPFTATFCPLARAPSWGASSPKAEASIVSSAVLWAPAFVLLGQVLEPQGHAFDSGRRPPERADVQDLGVEEELVSLHPAAPQTGAGAGAVSGLRGLFSGLRGLFLALFPLLVAVGHVAALLFLHHRRGARDGFAHLNGQVAKDGVVELEGVLELGEGLVADFDIHQHVVRLEYLLDGIRQLAPAPILDAVHLAVARGDGRPVTLDHGGHLLALIGMHDENDLVMAHVVSLWVKPPGMRMRWGKGVELSSPKPCCRFGEPAEYSRKPQQKQSLKRTCSPSPWERKRLPSPLGEGPGVRVPGTAYFSGGRS